MFFFATIKKYIKLDSIHYFLLILTLRKKRKSNTARFNAPFAAWKKCTFKTDDINYFLRFKPN